MPGAHTYVPASLDVWASKPSCVLWMLVCCFTCWGPGLLCEVLLSCAAPLLVGDPVGHNMHTRSKHTGYVVSRVLPGLPDDVVRSPDSCLLLSHSGSNIRALLRLCSCSASHTGTSTSCWGLKGPYLSCKGQHITAVWHAQNLLHMLRHASSP